MTKPYQPWIVVPPLFVLSFVGFILLRPGDVKAQQYPIMDKVADKIIMKYQNSSCAELLQKKQQNAPPSAEEQKAVAFLHQDAQMRAVFIGKIAPPIANKLFECGFIP
jgi:hypothetical protein